MCVYIVIKFIINFVIKFIIKLKFGAFLVQHMLDDIYSQKNNYVLKLKAIYLM